MGLATKLANKLLTFWRGKRRASLFQTSSRRLVDDGGLLFTELPPKTMTETLALFYLNKHITRCFLRRISLGRCS